MSGGLSLTKVTESLSKIWLNLASDFVPLTTSLRNHDAIAKARSPGAAQME